MRSHYLAVTAEADDQSKYVVTDRDVLIDLDGVVRVSFPIDALPALARFVAVVLEAERDLGLLALAAAKNAQASDGDEIAAYPKAVA